MKKIKDEVSLASKFEVITAMELRQNPGEVLDSVALGKTFLITKQGKPVAVLSKPPGETLTINVDKNGKVSYVA